MVRDYLYMHTKWFPNAVRNQKSEGGYVLYNIV